MKSIVGKEKKLITYCLNVCVCILGMSVFTFVDGNKELFQKNVKIMCFLDLKQARIDFYKQTNKTNIINQQQLVCSVQE